MDLSVPTGNADPRGPRTELLDPNERRRQRDRERYASMPKEMKEELNRKRRERRMENKGQVLENSTFVPHVQNPSFYYIITINIEFSNLNLLLFRCKR
jgi:hypothetical protein